MKVHKKPSEWNKFVFAEKLKWYAKHDNEVKTVFADKYKIKLILEELDLEDLKYAKIIEYVRPIHHVPEMKVLIPVDHLLKDEKYQISDWRIKKMFSDTKTSDEFWALANEKYGIVQEKDDSNIPVFYVVKLNIGWNTMIFFKDTKVIKMICGTREYDCELENIVKWRKLTLERYIKKTPPKFFIEEFIGFNLKVYEVYCIYGKPRILSVYYETDIPYEGNYLIVEDSVLNAETGEYSEVFSLNLIENAHLIPNAESLNIKINEDACKKICNHAKEFAKHFEFIRVDFYYTKNDIYFSECTFKPGALKRIKWKEIGQILSKYWTKTI